MVIVMHLKYLLKNRKYVKEHKMAFSTRLFLIQSQVLTSRIYIIHTFFRWSRPSAGKARLDSGDLSVSAVAISRSLSQRQSLLALALSSHLNLSRVGGEPELIM